MVGAIITIAAAAVATAVGGITSYLDNKAAAKAANAQGQAQANQYNQQAQIADIQASTAQLQGEQEASKRMRLMAQDVGSAYANYAGNGLSVDGRSYNDTIGDVVRSTKREGFTDINTIKDNAAMNVWTLQQTAANNRASAKNAMAMARYQASEYKRHAKFGLAQTFTGLPLTSNNGMGLLSSGLSMGQQAIQYKS